MQEGTEEDYNEYLQQEIALFELGIASERAALADAISGTLVYPIARRRLRCR